ncbi:hypothetical protein Scep_010165 [Stephania cephalantha]|uniref:NAC domain-containing protein n=1 Tax=Stephania cephalantha TaxID=152367 RepID=A0AAP0PEY7_9MAGN
MGLRDIEDTLPPGFRFAPSDEELVCHYLYDKITNKRASNDTMVEVNLHLCEPWQLPEMAKLGANEWYFFTFRDRKYSTGFRSNRATSSGYWKATGKDRAVVHPTSNAVVGMRKTLVFYNGRAPNGIKSGWVLHEFRLENGQMPPKEDWVLCRVFNKGKGDLNTTTTTKTTHAMRNDQYNASCLVSSPNLSSSSSPMVQTIMPTGHHRHPKSFLHHHSDDDMDPRFMLDLPPYSPITINIEPSQPHQLDRTYGTTYHEPISKIKNNEMNSKSGEGVLLDFLFDDSIFEDAESLDFDEMGFNERGHFG